MQYYYIALTALITEDTIILIKCPLSKSKKLYFTCNIKMLKWDVVLLLMNKSPNVRRNGWSSNMIWLLITVCDFQSYHELHIFHVQNMYSHIMLPSSKSWK